MLLDTICANLSAAELAERSKAAGLDMRFLQRLDADPLVAIVPSSHPPRYFFAGEADLHFDVQKTPRRLAGQR